MRQTSDGGFFSFMVIAALAILAIMILVIRYSKKQEEQRNAELQAIEAEKKKKAEAALKAEQDKKEMALKAIDQYKNEFELYAIESDANWEDDILDGTRVERAYNQRNQIQLIAYDPRYHVGKIRGTSYNYYLTSAAFCTCEDFRKRRIPCKHMFFLAHNIIAMGESTFIELDYEKGLFGLTGYTLGRFRNKEDAKRNLLERGLIVYDKQTVSTTIAVAGKTTASANVPVLSYSDALQIFTSEIRHPEVLEET